MSKPNPPASSPRPRRNCIGAPGLNACISRICPSISTPKVKGWPHHTPAHPDQTAAADASSTPAAPLALVVHEILQMIGVTTFLRERQHDHVEGIAAHRAKLERPITRPFSTWQARPAAPACAASGVLSPTSRFSPDRVRLPIQRRLQSG